MTLKLDAPSNVNYAAAIIKIGNPHDLVGLDLLHGFTVLGLQAITDKSHQPGELMVVFTPETQLSEEYARLNDLHRDRELNADPETTGFFEKNRRVKAIRLKRNASHAVLMPLSSLAYTGIDIDQLEPGMQFDTLNGHEICRKYVRPGTNTRQRRAVAKVMRRVEEKVFPIHTDTAQFDRAYADLRPTGGEVIVTQKLHGTSIRIGNVPAKRNKGFFERLVNRFVATPDFEHEDVYGSRRATKDPQNPNQDHFYSHDIWTENGQVLAGVVPRNVVVYGELIGWAGPAEPLQRGYTYDVPEGRAELYVYRVAVVNEDGFLVDLSWDGVKSFCAERNVKHVPEYCRIPAKMLRNREAIDGVVARYLDINHVQSWLDGSGVPLFTERPVPLSAKLVDEGICLRQEGTVPVILKKKAPLFFEHETKMADKGIESAEDAA